VIKNLTTKVVVRVVVPTGPGREPVLVGLDAAAIA
jgi:hypothetical protein